MENVREIVKMIVWVIAIRHVKVVVKIHVVEVALVHVLEAQNNKNLRFHKNRKNRKI